jgi:hypothetical protein
LALLELFRGGLAAVSDPVEQLYLRRWAMELSLRQLKITLQMDQLSCKTPENLDREIHDHIEQDTQDNIARGKSSAIYAVIAYNYFVSKVNGLAMQYKLYSEEFLVALGEYAKSKAPAGPSSSS